jgi:2-polyprenyl-3-methyl-5-hydroxy-6-metoxy-1,4-benzoquinol methylase
MTLRDNAKPGLVQSAFQNERSPTFEQMRAHSAVNALRAREAAKYGSAYFSEHYWREDIPGQKGNRGLSYDDPAHERRFDFLFASLIGAHAHGCVLDVGCGPGFLLERALRAGVDAYGVDRSKHALDLLRQRVSGHHRAIQSELSRLPFGDESFELTICLDVLEHLIVFDIIPAVVELCRISTGTIICSINLDNPYDFHPSILSRDSWYSIFESTNLVTVDQDRTDLLSKLVKETYEEYDMFVFKRK